MSSPSDTPSTLQFVFRVRPTRVEALGPAALAQIETHGEAYDGESRPARERVEGDEALYGLEGWTAIDADGNDVFDLWLSNVDAGTVFRAGSADVVGPITQGGFACTDLAAWERLAAADRSTAESDDATALRSVDFSIGDDTGPQIHRVPLALRDAVIAAPREARGLLGSPAIAIGSAWRALRIVVTPWDPDGALRALITASSTETLPGVRGVHGAPVAYFAPDALRAAAAVVTALPPDAIAQRATALAERIADPDYRDPDWLREILTALGAMLATAGEHDGAIAW